MLSIAHSHLFCGGKNFNMPLIFGREYFTKIDEPKDVKNSSGQYWKNPIADPSKHSGRLYYSKHDILEFPKIMTAVDITYTQVVSLLVSYETPHKVTCVPFEIKKF